LFIANYINKRKGITYGINTNRYEISVDKQQTKQASNAALASLLNLTFCLVLPLFG